MTYFLWESNKACLPGLEAHRQWLEAMQVIAAA
jgi:hypothetical protein